MVGGREQQTGGDVSTSLDLVGCGMNALAELEGKKRCWKYSQDRERKTVVMGNVKVLK
jgi:hypothetical protein